MSQNRRQFLQSSSAFAAGFAGLQRYIAAGELENTSTIAAQDQLSNAIATPRSQQLGVGPLTTDPHGLLDLPAGFSYRILSRQGDTMSDGFLVPAAADGMATFPSPHGLTVVVRNHEVYPSQQGPFGPRAELLGNLDQELLYDLGMQGKPCIGGTTPLVYDTKSQQLVRQFLSLSGTVRNCAGGPTPWGTWITCEEATDRPGVNTYNGVETVCEEYHGYNFEVPANADGGLNRAVPLQAMGRFRHEAVAVEPRSGIVFQTEDVDDGLIYRFIPNKPGVLAVGGKLQALAVAPRPGADTRNWTDELNFKVGAQHDVRWIDLDNVESPENDLRYRGFEAGAARFARAEGMWFADGNVYFACTTGGSARLGQIWKYTPSPAEGLAAESADPGKLELFIEPNNSKLVANADNLTAAPWGDLVVCEDRDGDEIRLVGITPTGECYTLAHNHAHSEFAGVCFSPDGSTLFVNLQREGLTVAITGPWPNGDA
ncbi:MAG: alkaline phosphatase PhoX [Bythopirellula sp.]